MWPMTHVLFVCSCNTFRSALAEHLGNLRAHKKGLNFQFSSCGTYIDGRGVDPQLTNLVRDVGLDLSSHTPRAISQEILDQADVVIGMSQEHVDFITENFGKPAYLFGAVAFGRRDLQAEWRGIESQLTRFELNRHQYFQDILVRTMEAMPKIMNTVPRIARLQAQSGIISKGPKP